MQSETKRVIAICRLCGEESQTICFNKERDEKIYSAYECLNCKVWFTHPVPSQDELSGFYSTGNYRAETGKRFVPILEKVIQYLTIRKRNRIKSYVKKGRILDIGCGRGLFLNIMKQDGWNVIGQEFDKKSASYAISNYGIDVLAGSFEGTFESNSFDVININHVLEHLEKPTEILSECYRILKKGGLLVVAVPNIDSFQAMYGKCNWFQLDIPIHLFHFSSHSLIKLLEKESYKVNLVRHFKFEYNPFGWLQTMLNSSGIQENLLYDLLKSSELKKNNQKTISFLDYFKLFLLLPLFLPLSFFLSTIEALFQKGGTIEVYSTKK